MMFITHISFAIFIGLMAVKFSSLPVSKYFFLLAIMLGSLLPDLDSATSFIGKKFKLVSLFFRHRGMIHSVVFLTVFSIIFFLITKNFYYFLAFSIGYLSHLFLDSLTPKGVAFFWPSKTRTRGSIKTTGLWDFLIFFVLVALNLVLML
jgi:inner membrane protein